MSGYVSPILGLNLLSEQQSGKATSVNDALLTIEQLLSISVISRTITTPPSAPSNGDRYIVPAGATGVWAGRENQIAGYLNGWRFNAPREGWLAWCA